MPSGPGCTPLRGTRSYVHQHSQDYLGIWDPGDGLERALGRCVLAVVSEGPVRPQECAAAGTGAAKRSEFLLGGLLS